MYRIIAPPRDRAEELYDLVSKIFGGNGYFDFLRFCRQAYFEGATYDWAVSRVAEAEGRLVGHVGVWDHRIRIGRARLRTGGIGAVSTHPDHRRRGIAAKIFGALMPAMRQAGYHLSMLGGIRDFYHRWGFAQAWPSTRIIADLAALPDAKCRLRVAKVALTEALCGRGAVMRIYNRDNATRTGTAARPIYTRGGMHWLRGECRTLSDPAGRVRGYLVIRTEGDDLKVLEVGGLGRGCGVGELLAAIRAIARRARCRRVVVEGLSWAHPLCVALRAGTCRAELNYTRSGGPMVAVVNLSASLEALAGELADRLRRSDTKAFRGALAVCGMGEKVTLRIAGGKVRVARSDGRLPAHRIVADRQVARLIIGSEPPSVLAAQGHVRFAGAGAELAEALFPHQWPMRNALDGY